MVHNKLNKLLATVMYCVIGLVPLLVMEHTTQVWSPLLSEVPLLASGEQHSLYTFGKALVLLVLTVIAITLHVCKKQPQLLLLPIGLFIGALLVSTFFSDTITIALFGQFNRMEGALTWVCYVLLFYVAAHMPATMWQPLRLALATAPFVLLNLILMIARMIDETSTLGTIGGTLNQVNYLSGAFSMLIVLYAVLWLTEKQRLIYASLLLLATLCLILTTSQIGFFTTLFVLSVAALLLQTVAPKKRIRSILLYIGLTLVLALSLSTFDKRIWEETFGFIWTFEEHTNDERLSEKLKDPMNQQIGSHEDGLPVLPAVATTALSSRLYIWEKTMDLIKERPMIGYGMDTLQYHFPHFNIDARAGISTERLIVDKPHSLYVDLLYGAGLFGLCSFFVVVATVATHVWKGRATMLQQPFAIAIICMLLAFFIQGLTNDSIIGLTSTFWVLLGIIYSKATV